MKKIAVGIISLGLSAALVFTGLKSASGVWADETEGNTVTVSTDTIEKNTGDPLTDGTEQLGKDAGGLIQSLLASDSLDDHSKTIKDETVYVIADANGNTQKVIVSDWLKNNLKNGTINDVSELNSIVNVKGDETYTQNGSACTWNANGADISYQGTTDKALPVNVKVRYYLDGNEMTPEEIKGKSGHVIIRFEYENTTKRTVKVDGKDEEMQVPFAALSGVILDDDRFSEIKASNARLFNDGSRTVVVGVAFPGLQESLKIDKEKFEIPESLEIEADVTDFSLGMTVTAVTDEIFAKLGSFDISSLDNFSDSMGQLNDAMKQLTDGSGALSDGLAQLLEKSGELEAGVGKLADGSSELKKGIKAADEGAGKISAGAGSISEGAGQLDSGIDQLKTGLDTLSSNNDALMAGALQVFNTMLKAAEDQLKEAGAEVPALTVENYSAVLDGIKEKLTQAAALYKASDPATSAVYTKKAEAVAGLKASLDSYNKFYTGLGTYTAGVAASANGAAQIKAGSEALVNGSNELKTGADALKDGTGKLYDGAEALNGGLEQLKSNIPALKNGVSELYNGSVLLKDGITEFNEKGIQKLTEAVEGELEGLVSRVRALGGLAADYNNFAGIADDMGGQVKFIYRTEEIK
ncbi:MAG: hypothetical protein IKU06_12380 [Lachnospiraceae bacterium]|nr:hypothetical protein [Lachnospiraceae bacterium]